MTTFYSASRISSGILLLPFSHKVMSDSLQPHGLQHARLFCPPLSPGVCSNSCPLSWWCYLPISSSATLFFCLQSFPALSLFQWVRFSHQVAKGLELKIQYQSFRWIFRGWFPLGFTGLISLQSKGLSKVIFSTTVQKHEFFSTQPSLWSNSHLYMNTGKTF